MGACSCLQECLVVICGSLGWQQISIVLDIDGHTVWAEQPHRYEPDVVFIKFIWLVPGNIWRPHLYQTSRQPQLNTTPAGHGNVTGIGYFLFSKMSSSNGYNFFIHDLAFIYNYIYLLYLFKTN